MCDAVVTVRCDRQSINQSINQSIDGLLSNAALDAGLHKYSKMIKQNEMINETIIAGDNQDMTTHIADQV